MIGTFFIPGVYAVEFTAFMDKTQGTIEDQFILTLVIKDINNISRPQLSSLPGFKVSFQNQSTQSQWTNGKGSTKISFSYALFPLKTGKLTIPAFSTSVDGKQYHTEPIQILVSESTDVPVEKKPAFVRSSLLVARSYPNQQVLYTFELFIRQGLRVANIRYERPDFSGFQVEEFDQKSNPEVRDISGQLFEVYTVRYALSPHKQGKIQISPATLNGDQIIPQQTKSLFKNSLLSKRKPFRLKTDPLTLDVLPFPTKDQPENFYGLVGIHTIQAALSQSEIKAGESATLTITITGPSRAESIQKPAIQGDKMIKTYEDQPSYQTELQDHQQVGTAVFTMAIVPSQAGMYTLPPVSITFFNPQSQSFESRYADIPALTVIPGAEEQLTAVGGNPAAAQKQNVVALGEDLLHIHQDMEALQNTDLNSSLLLTYGLLFLLGPFCFGIGYFWKWKIEHSAANSDKIRSNQAFSKFQKRIKQIHFDITENQQFAQAMMVVLKSYIGDKASKYGEALTSREIGFWLTEKRVEEELVAKLRNLLERCEMAQYAADSLSGDGKEQIYQAGQEVVQRLEDQLK